MVIDHHFISRPHRCRCLDSAIRRAFDGHRCVYSNTTTRHFALLLYAIKYVLWIECASWVRSQMLLHSAGVTVPTIIHPEEFPPLRARTVPRNTHDIQRYVSVTRGDSSPHALLAKRDSNYFVLLKGALTTQPIGEYRNGCDTPTPDEQ